MGLHTAARALALSCHPVPSAAVTGLAAGLGALAGLSAGRTALVAAAVLAGQLSIGWSNDALDAERDRAVRRSDKPVAAGAVSPRAVAVAAGTALVAAVALSATLGGRGGAAALLIVVCGWAYNLGAKATALSWAPYAVAFGALPAVATLSGEPPRMAPVWAIAAGAALGVAAHLANVLPDLRDDQATGVRGLPHRLGARGTAIAAAAVLLAGSAAVQLGSGGGGTWPWVGFGAVAALALGATAIAVRRPTSKLFFLAIIAIAILDLAFFALAGSRL